MSEIYFDKHKKNELKNEEKKKYDSCLNSNNNEKKILSRKNEYKISEVFSIYISIVYKLIEKNIKRRNLTKTKCLLI